MNVGDLEPPWVVDIVAEAGTDFGPVESWHFLAYRETGDGKVEAFYRDATATPGATPNVVAVEYAWQTGDTDASGLLHGVPVAVWPGGRPQSFPGATIEIQAPGPS